MFDRAIGIACLSVAFIVSTPGSRATTVAFPIEDSLNRRYLVDRNGVPIPIMGRTAWFITSLSVADYHTFVDDTAMRGYNAIEFHVVNHDSRGNNPPFNGTGEIPFLKRLDGTTWDGSLVYGNINSEAPDFNVPNETYWQFVDALLSYCDTKGLLVFLFPAYVGFQGGNQGWMQEMVANGPARMQSYGTWIATRYRNQKNLVWMMGGDFGNFNTDQNAVETALLVGLRSATDQESIHYSAEWDSGMISTDQMNLGAAMSLNGAYSFSGDVNSLGRRAFSRMPVEPAFLLEEPYDQEGPDGNGANPNAVQPVRRFQWWGWLSTTGGYVCGNGYVWPFRAPAWTQHLDTQGSRDMTRLNTFMNSIRWYKLVPSGLAGMPTLITAGGSSVSSADYVTASGTFDGTVIVAYIPPAHTGAITVDMSALSGPARARWFDPTNATYTEIGSGLPNTGMQVFTPKGNNSAGDADWVLLIERMEAPDIQSPAVNITAPKAGSTVSNIVAVSATATDNIGVVGVRFQVDSTDIGPEVFSPPYTISWNTEYVGNGAHTVRAVARDLADNYTASSASVTVSNVNSSLVGAYGLNDGAGISAADLSGYGNTGSINGASWTDQGKYGNALTFNGATDWVTINDSNSLDLRAGMTLEAWVYPVASTGGWTTIALKEAPPGAFGYMMQTDQSNHPVAYITTDTIGLRGVTGPQALSMNTWTHLAATYDGAMLSLYVNGSVVATTFVSGKLLVSGGPLRLGGNSIWGEYFAGTIDEVRFYNRPLSGTEIQVDLNTPVGAPTPSPTISPTATPSPTVSISGNVYYCPSTSVVPVPSVTLILTGSSAATSITDTTGSYLFGSLNSGGDFTVTPAKPPVLPGSAGAKINTIDMVAIQRHFLQIVLLPGCRLTAADVNNDTRANTIDIIAIQKFFLGGTTGIANVGKYRFAPANRTYTGIAGNQAGQNYDALVFGDVVAPFVE